jgi:hypothetical protein
MDAARVGSWTRRRFGVAAGGALTTVLGLATAQEAQARRGHHHKPKHRQATKADLEAIDDSGVSGFVTLHSLGKRNGTSITVHANGLDPQTEYISLYYDDDACTLEPYSEEDVIGDTYFPNADGIGHTAGEADDALNRIHSVSVRVNGSFNLVACATIDV